jgi:hypothetical protein
MEVLDSLGAMMATTKKCEYSSSDNANKKKKKKAERRTETY